AQLRIMHYRWMLRPNIAASARSIEHVRTTYVPRLGACDRLVHQSVVVVPVAATVGIMVPVARKAASSANPVHGLDWGAHCSVAAASRIADPAAGTIVRVRAAAEKSRRSRHARWCRARATDERFRRAAIHRGFRARHRIH